MITETECLSFCFKIYILATAKTVKTTTLKITTTITTNAKRKNSTNRIDILSLKRDKTENIALSYTICLVFFYNINNISTMFVKQ